MRGHSHECTWVGGRSALPTWPGVHLGLQQECIALLAPQTDSTMFRRRRPEVQKYTSTVTNAACRHLLTKRCC